MSTRKQAAPPRPIAALSDGQRGAQTGVPAPIPCPATLASAVESWFRHAARPLPWRTTPRDPWASLVSEVMAQQTQIARVLERFPEFLARFPTPAALAAADEQVVLAMWSGMGYYRRARLLHAAARAIVADHAGRVPESIDALRGLPGIGRYTAGAIASISLGRPEAIVDGNVARVLLRVHGHEGRAGDRATDAWCWARAGDLVALARDPAAFNEGLMELGAIVCTPRAPRCDQCPLADVCIARRENSQDRIPAPNVRRQTPIVHALVLIARNSGGQVLVEQRPVTPRGGGMWAGMWQLPTLEAPTAPTAAARLAWAHGPTGRAVLALKHQTSHRLFHFEVRRAECDAARAKALGQHADRKWIALADAARLPMSNPQRRMLRLAE